MAARKRSECETDLIALKTEKNKLIKTMAETAADTEEYSRMVKTLGSLIGYTYDVEDRVEKERASRGEGHRKIGFRS